MFKDLDSAWAEMERNFMAADEAKKFPDRAQRMVNYGKDMFYLGAYTSTILSNAIARYVTDEDDALAKLQELKHQCVSHLDTTLFVPEDEEA